MPRGNGKSYIAARLIHDLIHPESPYFVNGDEIGLLAANLSQARIAFRYMRDWHEDSGLFRWQDSSNKLGITLPGKRGHWKTTKLTAFSSDGKGAMGIVKMPWVIADEPGAWEVNKGALMADALFGALGKPGSRLRLLFIGTKAPAMGGWWIELVDGGTDEKAGIYVECLQGDRDTWDQWQTIRKANPLTAISAEFRKQLLIERDKARNDSRLKARFLSYRLNLPSGDESEMVLNLDDWEMALGRPVAEPDGDPIIGVDLGAGRAFSAAVAIWPNGRVEAIALAPGVPNIEDQETRDIVPKGTYQKLIEDGNLEVDEGKRVQRVSVLTAMIENKWPNAQMIVCDRFRALELEDNTSLPIEPRVTRWSEAAEDIRALRQWAKDGPLSVEKNSRRLITASLGVAMVKNDDQGNCRLVKRGSNNQARDDVVAALILAVGEAERQAGIPDLVKALELINQS